MLEPRPLRLHRAHRQGVLARMRSAGWPREDADAALTAWEAIADAEGRERGRAAYWEGCDEWIANRRRT